MQKLICKERRAVSDVIATLLMVAIAAVGGTAVFGVSQGFFNENQPTLPDSIEKLKLVGYDATDSVSRKTHQGDVHPATGVSLPGEGKMGLGDKVYIYLQNPGLNPVGISEFSFAGIQYSYEQALDTTTEPVHYSLEVSGTASADGTAVDLEITNKAACLSVGGTWTDETETVDQSCTKDVVTGDDLYNESLSIPDAGKFSLLLSGEFLSDSRTADIPPGKEVTLILSLEDSIKLGREAQSLITTAKGTIISHKITLGTIVE